MMKELSFIWGDQAPLISLLCRRNNRDIKKICLSYGKLQIPDSSLFSKHSTNQTRNNLEFILKLFGWRYYIMTLSIPYSLRLLNYTKTFCAKLHASLQVT